MRPSVRYRVHAFTATLPRKRDGETTSSPAGAQTSRVCTRFERVCHFLPSPGTDGITIGAPGFEPDWRGHAGAFCLLMAGLRFGEIT